MQPTKLFSKGIVTGYRRGQRNQDPSNSLVKIEGMYYIILEETGELCIGQQFGGKTNWNILQA